MEIIDKIKQLDLSLYPIAELTKLLQNLGELGFLVTNFNKVEADLFPKEIERAVNNTLEEPEFNSVSRISFKPPQFNTNFLRASTPKNTMFYGSVISDHDMENEEAKITRIVGATEVSSLMRNSDIIEGWSRMTFGKWEVIENISLLTMIDPSLNYEKKYLNELKNLYVNMLNDTPEEIKENTMKCLKFISEEFSKYVSSGNNHEYLISSLFTELWTKKPKYDGIIYPSVQSDGYGLCVAIHPRAMNKLKLTKVLQCKVSKKINPDNTYNFRITNEKRCKVKEGSESFELIEIIDGKDA
jgi:hypothetical protein